MSVPGLQPGEGSCSTCACSRAHALCPSLNSKTRPRGIFFCFLHPCEERLTLLLSTGIQGGGKDVTRLALRDRPSGCWSHVGARWVQRARTIMGGHGLGVWHRQHHQILLYYQYLSLYFH